MEKRIQQAQSQMTHQLRKKLLIREVVEAEEQMTQAQVAQALVIEGDFYKMIRKMLRTRKTLRTRKMILIRRMLLTRRMVQIRQMVQIRRMVRMMQMIRTSDKVLLVLMVLKKLNAVRV